MYMVILVVLAVTYSVLICIIAFRVLRALRKFRIKKPYTAALEAPSVSVCIPARNETHAMTRCLEDVLASDYKKLEVIVYDDSSTDDTSELVRAFAHSGVRFVPGTELAPGWLGRNHALEVLAREANGTYVLFMDVDTSITPSTISRMVSYMMTEGVVMASVIPGRPSGTMRASALFGHLRYFWEVILDRVGEPATSSSLWMINRHVLIDTLGGFAPHKAEVDPEGHIAGIIGFRAYHCLLNNSELGVTYEKKWRSQRETSRRVLYPMIGGRWYGAVVGIVVLLALNIPLCFVVFGLASSIPLFVAGLMLYGVMMVVYGGFLGRVWLSRAWLGALAWPYVILQELFLFVSSVIGYVRHSITWKGRSITASPIRVDHIEINE
jgi:glycosyltransferase involved in cell wall biosynthesis